MRQAWDEMNFRGRVIVIGSIVILWMLLSAIIGEYGENDRQASADSPGSGQFDGDAGEWADQMEAAYLQMVGRDSWSDHCFEDKAEWACETYGMDAQSIGVLQLQMNGRYDDPYLEDLADRGINAVMSTLAYYDETEDHMDWIMAVDHAGTPILQKSCSSIYRYLPDPPVCAQ